MSWTVAKFTTRLAIIVVASLPICRALPAQDLSGIKCVVNGDQNASVDASIKYRDGKVHVCCQACVKEFKADPTAFATRANHQLVLTGQYRQSKCPITGGEMDSNVTASVAGTQIAFCCESCLKKVNDAEQMADQAEMVFGNKPFEKYFVKVESAVSKMNLSKARCIVQPDRDASQEISVEYLGGKVFFCCSKCAEAFEDSPEKYTIAANHQLVVTGHYIQTGCPLIGGTVTDEYTATVGGVPVKGCCEKCVAAINAAKSDKEKAALVFASEPFAQAFKMAATLEPQTDNVKQ